MRVRFFPITLSIVVGLPVLVAEAAAAPAGCTPPEMHDIEERVVRNASQDPPAQPPLTILYDPLLAASQPADRMPDAIESAGLLDEVMRELNRPAGTDEECGTLHPLADTVFMRHPGTLPFVSVPVRRIFAAADIARSPETVEALLRPLLALEYPRIVRYRAALELMLRAMRLSGDGGGDVDPDLMAVARALVPDVAPGAVDPAADLDFIEAVLCLEKGDRLRCRPLLDNALHRDPWFVAARRLRISLLDTAIRALPDGASGARRCASLAGALLLDIRNMVLGVGRRESRVEIAQLLARDAEDGNPVLHLGAAHAFIEAGAWRQATAALDAAATALSPEIPCGTELRKYVDDFRIRLPRE